MNTITIIGNLGTDPETRVTPSGQKVVSFSVAVNTRNGNQDVTIWYRISVWGDRFAGMMSYLKKGSSVVVIGDLKPPRIYNDKNGQPQVSLEVNADILRFNSSGRAGDRALGTEGGAEGGQNGGFAPRAAAASNPMANSYASQAASPADYGMGGHGSLPEDDLPF